MDTYNILIVKVDDNRYQIAPGTDIPSYFEKTIEDYVLDNDYVVQKVASVLGYDEPGYLSIDGIEGLIKLLEKRISEEKLKTQKQDQEELKTQKQDQEETLQFLKQNLDTLAYFKIGVSAIIQRAQPVPEQEPGGFKYKTKPLSDFIGEGETENDVTNYMRSVERTIQRWYFYWFDKTYPTYTEIETYDNLSELAREVGKASFKGYGGQPYSLPMYGLLPGAVEKKDMIGNYYRQQIVLGFIDCMKMLDATKKGNPYTLEATTTEIFKNDELIKKLSDYRYPGPNGGRRASV